MLADLFVAFPPLQRWLRLGAPWVDRMFPAAAFSDEARAQQREALTDTRVAQPALGIAGLAMTELLASCGLRPDIAGGHSYGELVALAVAGALPDHELLALSEQRGRAMLGAAGDDPGTMVAVARAAWDVRSVLSALPGGTPGGVVVANDNSPAQVVLSGPTPGMEEAVAALEAAGVACRPIPVACAFHSSVVAGAETAFAETLAPVGVRPPVIDVFANTTAAPYPSDPGEIRALLARQLASPVRFREQVEAMYDAGVRTFVEAGSGRVLTQLVGKILKGRPHTAVACDVPGENGVRRFLLALAELAVTGAPVDMTRLFDGRARPVDPSAVTKRSGWKVNGHLVRTASGEIVPGGLLPASDIARRVGASASGPGSAPSRGPAASGTAEPPSATVGSAVAAPIPAGAPPVAAMPVSGGERSAPAPATVVSSERDMAMLSYLSSMRELVDAQRQVFLRYLGGPVESVQSGPDLATLAEVAPPAAAAVPAVAITEQAVIPNGSAAPGTDPAPAGLVAPAAPDIMTLLTTLVSERTGYPLDMLGADLDLEADLSIDSIKRLEILGELTERAGLPGTGGPGQSLDESIVEELVAQKSLRAIVTWVESHLGIEGTAPPPGEADAGSPPGESDTGRAGSGPAGLDGSGLETVSPEVAPSASPSDVPHSTVRAVFRTVPAPPAVSDRDGHVANGHGLAVVDDGRGIAPLVVSLLGSHGVPARVVEPHGIPGNSGGIVHLGLLFPGSQTAADIFEQVHPAAVAGADTLVAVTGLGGTHGRFMGDDRGSDRPAADTRPGGSDGASRAKAQAGQYTGAGVAGLWRALARERPDAHVRAVDLDPGDDPVVLAGHIVSEVLASGGPVTVGYRQGERCTVVAAEEALEGDPDHDGHDGQGDPDHEGHFSRRARREDGPGTELGPESVVLLTGGARGITARLAVCLASTYGCSLELVGRSPLPSEPEDPEFTAAADATELRRVLIARGEREPAAIESSVARLLAAREIRSNLTALENAGVKVSYHAVDVRDADALRGVVDSVYDRHGRLDGIVHGAGVIEDRLLADKTPESFRRVFDTKVGAAHRLVSAVREPHPFLILFTSVSGAFGNKGQVDYAAANDALATLAWSLDAQQFGPVVAVDWGPWAGSGMVTPQLDREYARRGVGLVHPDDGVARLLDELRMSLPEPEIVLARARVSTFEAPSGPVGEP
jgi:malonyl CoA-acyl carrier protein transacylase